MSRPAAILAFFSAGLIGVLLVRFALASVVTTEAGVIARGPFRTRRLAWDEVAAFRTGAAGFGSDAAIVETVDGREYRLWGLGGPSSLLDPNGNDGACRWVPELNDELGRHRRADTAAS